MLNMLTGVEVTGPGSEQGSTSSPLPLPALPFGMSQLGRVFALLKGWKSTAMKTEVASQSRVHPPLICATTSHFWRFRVYWFIIL